MVSVGNYDYIFQPPNSIQKSTNTRIGNMQNSKVSRFYKPMTDTLTVTLTGLIIHLQFTSNGLLYDKKFSGSQFMYMKKSPCIALVNTLDNQNLFLN